MRRAAASVVGEAGCVAPHPTLAGEDMAFYLEQRDGAFFFCGSSPVDLSAPGAVAVPHHRPDFDIDERCLGVGASVFVRLVLDLLGEEALLL